MTMSKEEIDRRVEELQKIAEKLQDQMRVRWLNRVCREARDQYGFSSLGELIKFMVDHAGDIQVKSGDTT